MTTNLTDKNESPAKKDGAKMAGPARPAPAKKAGSVEKITRYLQEVQGELKKTTWPDRAKLTASTKIVLGAVIVTGLYLYLIDIILTFALGWIVQKPGH